MGLDANTPGTGLPSLDRVIGKVIPGDNIVWQIDLIGDYAVLVESFSANAIRSGRKLVYFRFARHPALLSADSGAEIHVLSPEVGFETFTAQIHKVIGSSGRGTYYVFDCLSDLAVDWYSDLMLGNFFMVTCPYLFELDTVTYFALFRGYHSSDAVSAIRETTQLLLDIFRHGEKLYVHPLKVDKRHSPTMYLPHVWENDDFRPLAESSVLSDVLDGMTSLSVGSVSRTLDIWERKFLQAREALDDIRKGVMRPEEADELYRWLLRMIVTRDERIIALASKYLDLSDVLAIRKRMIGTGLIGGKSVGMLLARAILCRTDPRWRDRLERHDSFYIGSDVFYTFLVRNRCWGIRRSQRSRETFLEGAEEVQQKILSGTFPPFLREQFVAMLEYFGQSPIIVRSSSLLEDGFGNAFTGKYESVFCPNQGSPQERLSSFLTAIQTVYASSMGKEALLYRAHRGLLDRDEQMAILVQRVSGAIHGHLFYPQIAGVGLSYNPYAWSEYIEPEAGVIRLVFGLGTRAVNRSDDDYTRVIAMNAPLRRPEASIDEVMEYAQRRVDVLDLAENRFSSLYFDQVLKTSPALPVEMFASRKSRSSDRGGAGGTVPWILTFDRLLSETTFIGDMREMLKILRDAYDYPVDIEFTANFLSDGSNRINLVQCRPLQVREGGRIVAVPDHLPARDVVLEAQGTIVGQSSFTTVDRLIYVVPSVYMELPITDRYSVARMIGRLTHVEEDGGKRNTIMLLGPGRWGTSTPSLGVPVSFAEINTVSVLCEIVGMHGTVVPDVSLGTHFFNDLVEANMLYLAVYHGKKGNFINEEFFERKENRLADLLPEEAEWADVVRVIDIPEASGGRAVYLNANSPGQRAICYLAELGEGLSAG
ncbi:MAG TPA: PEP/pyruvate-binding domain-containing protein [Candidatus Deferrimicrobiaceae bacterium]|nr:PEP/pyruvate-binding domain-containing protein [Candidatus Deferrimicrobiaceae bacterium]